MKDCYLVPVAVLKWIRILIDLCGTKNDVTSWMPLPRMSCGFLYKLKNHTTALFSILMQK